MLNSAAIAALALPTPAPLPNANAATAAAGDARPFAQVLGQASAQQHAAAHDGDARQAAEPAAHGADQATGAASVERPAATAARGRAQGQAVAPDARATAPVAAAPDSAVQGLAADDSGAVPVEDVMPESSMQALIDLAAWVSGLPLPPAPGSDPKTASSAQGDTAPSAAVATESASAAAAARPALLPGADGPSGADAGRAGAAAPVTAGSLEAAAAQPADRREPAAADTSPGGEGAVAGAPQALLQDGPIDPSRSLAPLPAPAVPLAGATAVTAALAATPTKQADLGAAPGSREFAPALGAQLSLLVRDGIEHAQLRLSPAELGPIDVRITLEGTRAQVDFAAAHASTRQALHDAVPVLAGALREAGLTLSGGGVFEQAREQRGEASPRDARQAAGAQDRSVDDGLPAVAAPRMPRARGVLDLYA